MKKAFFDLGPGVLNSEAWDPRWEGYTIVGVEPDPARYATLKESFPGILLKKAVSDNTGVLSFTKHPTSGYIAFGYPGCTTEYLVETTTLDQLDEKYGLFDEIAIWADIEGSELRMLQGATEVLKKTKWITLELHTCPKTEEWCRSHDVFNFLIASGFTPMTPERPCTEEDSCYDVVFIK